MLLVLLLFAALLTASCGPGFHEHVQARIAQQPYYRAAAYSPSTHVCGFTSQNAGQDASIAEATQNCGAQDCASTARWVKGSCLAFARGPGDAWGWGMSGDEYGAKREAMRQCRARASGCEVACWTCTDPML